MTGACAQDDSLFSLGSREILRYAQDYRRLGQDDRRLGQDDSLNIAQIARILRATFYG